MIEDFSRVIGLSDGLFATVLTVLVLNLQVPAALTGLTGAELSQALVQLWPSMFSYILTFVVIAFYWLAHLGDFRYIVRGNRQLLWMNLMFLLTVGILPFTTAAVGNHSSALTWLIYACNMFLVGSTLTIVWGYAASHEMLRPGMDPAFIRFQTWFHMITPAVFLLTIPIAQFSVTWAGLAAWLSLIFRGLADRWRPVALPARPDTELLTPEQSPGQELMWRLLGWLPLLGFVGWAVWYARHGR